MATKDLFEELLRLLNFWAESADVYSKTYVAASCTLKVNLFEEKICYEECGIEVGRSTTSNFSSPENLVVLECVDRLLAKGYKAADIELEPQWKLGHTSKSGFADIWVRTRNTQGDKNSLLIIECKKPDEFNGAWSDTKTDGAQLFSYFQQEPATKFLCLYTSSMAGGSVKPVYHLINVQDNARLLSSDSKAESYKDKNDRQRHRVWSHTYNCDYATRGLFEEDIPPYHIGKSKYSVGDLVAVDNSEIQKKYHEFALILRQHNVSGRENAFDKLVNLFLAKVVDETNNPSDLSFYWKGTAYDDDFQLQDRLQRLYRDGMKKFLGEEVTYIENGEIEKSFRRFKGDPDATKKTIMAYFRALKFFSENDFSFISVHNEKLFRQNAVILRKVVRMLQDIQLKTTDGNQNQFLGDLFEGFLNKGVKQSEGQFFTPMPIVRFVVSALPLEDIVRHGEQPPFVIDYACGAGHFLTEYAVRVKEYAQAYHPDVPLASYYAHITGIEKEYRLSKVSKVSAFMYGHDDINIVYADALVPHKDVREGAYSVLVANPPYSVSGFLETLSDRQRRNYSLYSDKLNVDKNNAIEAFFIERAAQLLKTGGVAGVILPSSVLNKGGVYTQAREIVLRNFEIVALAEMGSGTFGKTGTNTVIMFLRRRETNTPDAEHFENRVNGWFGRCDEADAVYRDGCLVEAYCRHCGYDVDDYKLFMRGIMTARFQQHDTLKTYEESFFADQRNAMKDVCDKAKTIRSRYVAKVKTKVFMHLPEEMRISEGKKAFLDFVTAIEKDKLYYFLLAQSAGQPVVLVKMPTSNADGKKFLGYEWSDSKGNEGIKYLNVANSKAAPAEEGEETEDDDTMRQVRGIDGIRTPLFNPEDLRDEEKINTLIRKNFLGEALNVPKNLSDSVTLRNLTDMLDFSRTAFPKEFRTAVEAERMCDSKYPLALLEDLLQPVEGATTKIGLTDILPSGEWPVVTQEAGRDISGFSNVTNPITDVPLIVFGDHSCTFKYVDYRFVRGADGTQLIKTDGGKVLLKFVYYFLLSVRLKNAGKYERHFKYLRKMQIPLPPLAVQRQIVAECEAEDARCAVCKERIKELKTALEDEIDAMAGEYRPLKSFMRFVSQRIPLKDIDIRTYVTTDNMLQDCAGIRPYEGGLNMSSANSFARGDILISNIRPYLKKIWLADCDGSCSPDVFVLRCTNEKEADATFVYYSLRRASFFDHVMSDVKGMKMPRGKKEVMERYSMILPPMEVQKTYAARFRGMDLEIEQKVVSIQNSDSRKRQILSRYLGNLSWK